MLNNDTISVLQTYLVSVSFSEKVNAKGVLRLIKKVEQLKHINFSVHQDEHSGYAISMIISTPENYELSYQQFVTQFEFLERPGGAVLL